MAVRELPVTGHFKGTGSQEIRNVQAWQSAGAPAEAATEGVFWYDTNAGNKRLYFRDNAGAVPVPRLDRAETLSGQWTFSPESTQPPFVLGANAQGQKVVGLNADQLDGRDSNTNPTANTIALRDSNGRLTAEDPVGLTDLVNLQYLNDALSFLTISAAQVTTGLLALARGGTNADLSAAATGGLIYKGASALAATAALTGVLIGNGASAPTAVAQLAVAQGGTGGATASAARTNLDVLWADDARGLIEARSSRGGCFSDGSAGSKITASGFSAGTGNFSVSFVATILKAIPASYGDFYMTHSAGNNRLRIGHDAVSGRVQLAFYDSGGTQTNYFLTPDVALVDGTTYRITVTFDRAGVATLYVNAITDRDKNSTGVTVNISAASAIDIGSGNANSSGWFNTVPGTLYEALVFNHALSAAQVAELNSIGSVPNSQQWGSFSVAYTSDFSAGVDGWASDASRTVTGNVDAIDAQNDWLKVETTSTVSLYAYRIAASTQFVTNGYYRIKGRVHNPAGSPFSAVHVGRTSGPTTERQSVSVAAGTTVEFNVVIYSSGNTYLLIVADATTVASGNPFYLKNVTVEKVGAVQALDLENARPSLTTSIKDRSSNSNHGTATTGLTQIKAIKQLNAENVLNSALTANSVVYAGTGGLLTGLGLNTGAVRFLTQTSSAAPAWTDLFGGANTWTGNQTFNGTVTIQTPTLAAHAATKAYVDSAVSSGLRVLASCTLATTANVTLSGEQTIDGVLTSGTRILVKNQSTASQNGIYVTSSGAWSRATDCDAASEITTGAYTYVTSGSTNAGTSWTQTQAVTTIGTDSVQWQLFFQQAAYAQGTGITISGLTISINQAANLDWTGSHTFTSSSGVALKPHGASAGNTTVLKFLELAANGTSFVGFKAPDSLAGDVTWVLPATDGSANHYLKTNGSGALSFAQIASTEISNTSFVTGVTGTTGRVSVTGTLAPTIDIDSGYVGQTSITTLGTIGNGAAIWRATPIEVGYGGTSLTSYATGDLIYASATNVLGKRAIGTAGTFLQSLSGVPNWSGYTLPTSVAANQLLYGSSGTAVAALAAVASRVLTTDGAGVLAWRNTLPSGLSVEGDTDAKIVKMKWFNVGNGTDTTITLSHNFNTRDVIVKIFENDAADNYREYPLVPLTRPTVNTVQLEFVTAPTSGQFRACVEAAI